MKDDGGQGQGLKSLDTALRVLALIARYPAPQPLSTIAKDAGVAPSQVHRYLASFVQAGLVHQDGRSGRYGIGPEALRLGVSAISQHDFVDSAAEGLSELAEMTGMTALLSVWANEGATVVRLARGVTPTDTAIGLGSTLPLLNSATGHVFLAWGPAPIVKETAKKQMRVMSKNPVGRLTAPTTKAQVDALINQVRDAGYASTIGNFIPGLVAIAAPILDWQREVQAVVTLVGIDPTSTEAKGDVAARLLTFCRANSSDFSKD